MYLWALPAVWGERTAWKDAASQKEVRSRESWRLPMFRGQEKEQDRNRRQKRKSHSGEESRVHPEGTRRGKPAHLLGVLWLGAAGDLREQLRSEAEARGWKSQV